MAEVKRITAVLEAEDRTGSGFASAGKETEKFSDKMKKLGAVLVAAFATTAVINFGKDAVKAFADAEASGARVAQTIENTMKKMSASSLNAIQKLADAAGGPGADAFDYLAGQIDKASTAAVKLGFDDEAAAESMAKFFQRTQDLTKAQNLNAIAMDLARAKSIDLGTATDMVNMVLSGNGKVLKQYGITIDETKGPLEALGQLHEQVAGQAAAFAETTQGKMEILSNTWENFQETVGGVLANVLTPLLQFITDIVTKITDFEAVGKAFGAFFEALDAQTGLVTLFKEAWQAVVDTYTNTLKPALDELWVALQPYKPFLDALVVVFGTMLVVAIGILIKTIQGLIMLLGEALTIFAQVATFVTNVLTAAFSGIQSVIEGVYNMVQKLIDAFKRLNVVQGAKDFVGGIGKKVGGFLGINDGIVQNGKIITTHPDDYIIATKHPETLGGRGGINITIQGNTFMGKEGIAKQIADEMLRQVNLRAKF